MHQCSFHSGSHFPPAVNVLKLHMAYASLLKVSELFMLGYNVYCLGFLPSQIQGRPKTPSK